MNKIYSHVIMAAFSLMIITSVFGEPPQPQLPVVQGQGQTLSPALSAAGNQQNTPL
jgi:hypothetical protein